MRLSRRGFALLSAEICVLFGLDVFFYALRPFADLILDVETTREDREEREFAAGNLMKRIDQAAEGRRNGVARCCGNGLDWVFLEHEGAEALAGGLMEGRESLLQREGSRKVLSKRWRSSGRVSG